MLAAEGSAPPAAPWWLRTSRAQLAALYRHTADSLQALGGASGAALWTSGTTTYDFVHYLLACPNEDERLFAAAVARDEAARDAEREAAGGRSVPSALAARRLEVAILSAVVASSGGGGGAAEDDAAFAEWCESAAIHYAVDVAMPEEFASALRGLLVRSAHAQLAIDALGLGEEEGDGEEGEEGDDDDEEGGAPRGRDERQLSQSLDGLTFDPAHLDRAIAPLPPPSSVGRRAKRHAPPLEGGALCATPDAAASPTGGRRVRRQLLSSDHLLTRRQVDGHYVSAHGGARPTLDVAPQPSGGRDRRHSPRVAAGEARAAAGSSGDRTIVLETPPKALPAIVRIARPAVELFPPRP